MARAIDPAVHIPPTDAESDRIGGFLADRIYEFNVRATGYADGRSLAGAIRDDAGEIIAGFHGHTWGGACELAWVWVHEQHRGHDLGRTLLHAAETEAVRRGCELMVLRTHDFQAPAFYEHLGYARRYAIDGLPRGHADIIYTKRLLNCRTTDP